MTYLKFQTLAALLYLTGRTSAKYISNGIDNPQNVFSSKFSLDAMKPKFSRFLDDFDDENQCDINEDTEDLLNDEREVIIGREENWTWADLRP